MEVTMQTPAVNNSNTVQAQNAAPAAEKIAGTVPAADGSTLTSANPAQEQSFVEMISDKVVGAFTWVKEKVVSLFSYIRSLCCGVSDEVKAEQLTALTEKKALVEKTRENLLKERTADTSKDKKALKDFWRAAFDSLPQDLQDALVKEDIKDIKKAKFAEAYLAKIIEESFKDAAYKADRLGFIRDLNPAQFADPNGMPQDTYHAYDDKYLPSYLQHIASQIGKEVKDLAE